MFCPFPTNFLIESLNHPFLTPQFPSSNSQIFFHHFETLPSSHLNTHFHYRKFQLKPCTTNSHSPQASSIATSLKELDEKDSNLLILFYFTHHFPTNLVYFPKILTLTHKKFLFKDSMRDMIPNGALKIER